MALSGELDLTAVDQLRDLLTTTLRINPVVDVDLSQLTFLDSTFLSVLVTAYHDATAAGGTLNLISPAPPATSARSSPSLASCPCSNPTTPAAPDTWLGAVDLAASGRPPRPAGVGRESANGCCRRDA
ncbi:MULTISPECIES: STAS domain-containing protein [Micromonospora]|uniref:STAS domain-containing protein n=1 Tax=Micromonospora TaxID=1873 RepID=UPI0034E03317